MFRKKGLACLAYSLDLTGGGLTADPLNFVFLKSAD